MRYQKANCAILPLLPVACPLDISTYLSSFMNLGQRFPIS